MGTALAEMLTTELARGEALRTLPGENVAQARKQLDLDSSSSLAGDDLERVRSILSCDFLVSGSYVTLGDAANDVRLDLRLQDAALGTTLASLARDGQKAELFSMVAALGSELRGHLGVDEAGGKDDPLAGLPQQPDAARLYAEALDKLRASQAREAREMLEQASRLAPQNALVYSALSQAWESEGYGQRAAEAARRAFENSSSLPREDRLAVEGRFREATADWPGAIEVYRKLSDYFPDDLEYGLRLAAAQTQNRESDNALRTLEDLRRLPAPISEDPRIDLAEASAAGLASDFNRQLEAAGRAGERAATAGASVLVAQARLAESQAHRVLGRLSEAEEAARGAYELYGNLDHPSGTTQALTALANIDFDHGHFDTAAERYRQVISDYRRLGDQDGTASGLNNLAMVLKKRGDLDSAQRLYEESAEIFEATGDTLAMTFSLNNLGVLLVARDRLAEAGEMFERSREAWQKLGNRSGLAYSLNNLAAVHHLRGDLATSRSVHQEALAIRRETGEKSGEAASLTNLAEVLGDLGEIKEAKSLLDRALELTDEIGDRSARGSGASRPRSPATRSRTVRRSLRSPSRGLGPAHRTGRATARHRAAGSPSPMSALKSGDLDRAESESQMAILSCPETGTPGRRSPRDRLAGPRFIGSGATGSQPGSGRGRVASGRRQRAFGSQTRGGHRCRPRPRRLRRGQQGPPGVGRDRATQREIGLCRFTLAGHARLGRNRPRCRLRRPSSRAPSNHRIRGCRPWAQASDKAR